MVSILLLLLAAPPQQAQFLTDVDKAVIEAALSPKERGGQRIVFVTETVHRGGFMNLLAPVDKQQPCVKDLIRRNARSVFLGDYLPSWAVLSANSTDAQGWYGPGLRDLGNGQSSGRERGAGQVIGRLDDVVRDQRVHL